MHTDNQIDNPTEWESMIGAAIVDPSKTAEMQRKIEVKLTVQNRMFCDCGSTLDQTTAVCLVQGGKVRNVSCPACMAKALRESLQKMTERYGADHTQTTIAQDFSLISWAGTTTGAEIWSIYSSPAPKAPKAPKKPKPDRWMTPAQIAADCYGWTPGATLVISGPYIMQPDAAGRAKLEKRAPNGVQNHDRFARLIPTAERWLSMIAGSTLTAGDTTTDAEGVTSTAFLGQYGCKVCKVCAVNARIIRTVEHYCGAGHWCFGPPKEVFIAYRNHSGATMAIVSPLTDD